MRLLTIFNVTTPRSFSLALMAVITMLMSMAAVISHFATSNGFTAPVWGMLCIATLTLLAGSFAYRQIYTNLYAVAEAYETDVQKDLRSTAYGLATSKRAISNPVAWLIVHSETMFEHYTLMEPVNDTRSDAQREANAATSACLLEMALDIAIARDIGWKELNNVPRTKMHDMVKAREARLKKMTKPQGEFGGAELLRVVLSHPSKELAS